MKQDDIFNRYSRQVFIDEIGVEGQRKIMDARVLVVGAGGLGSPVIQYLAASGVGTLGVVDFDRVELHNLNRQVIHTESQVGKAKVDSAGDFVRSVNSHVDFIPMDKKLTVRNAKAIIQDFDIVVEGSDNFTTRYVVNDVCVALGKPLVYGSIFGFEGQLAVFNFQGSKNLRDIFPDVPPPEDVPSCDSNGVLGPLPGTVGSLMAMQVLKIITGLPVKVNVLTVIDIYQEKIDRISF